MTELDALRARIEAHLAEASGAPVTVRRAEPLSGGACQDNFRIEATFEGGPLAGDRALVLRSDAERSLPGSIDRRRELAVVRAAVAGGVRPPPAHFETTGLVREGAHAYFLAFYPGEAIGRKIVRDEALAEARKNLAGELGEELAKIHALTPARIEELTSAPLDLPVPADPIAAALEQARATLDALPEPRPALELALAWLEDHRPAPTRTVLVHGDYRTGNFLVTKTGLSAILDWEFAHFGAPEEDLAWIALRNWRFGRIDKPIGGFATRDDFHRAYESKSGTVVDRARVHFWEVMGNVRWGAGCIQQGERYLSGGEQDIELIAIPRLAAEMEFEALRLIQKGF